MRMRLDQIEARLQALIERSVARFARGDEQQRLAHQLVEAVRQHLEPTEDGNEDAGSEIAPPVFNIVLHPDSLAYWEARGQELIEISKSLREVAREHGVTFSRDPLFLLTPDPNLPLEGIVVLASEQPVSSGHTASFAPAQVSRLNQEQPLNAFLIVEGSRVFPLDRAVINIGRRADNQLVLADPRVSRAHAQIRAVRGQYILFDLNSTGGTMVNGRRVHQCALKPGDVISLSGVPLIYGEETPDDDGHDMGYTQSMAPSGSEPPEIIE